MEIEKIIKNKKVSIEEIFNVYDQLDPVSLDSLIGQWAGKEISTGHPLDGTLDIAGWYGKKFESPEDVHPLVMYTYDKKELYACDPSCLTFNTMIPIEVIAPLIQLTCLSNKTTQSSARIRMMEYRGVTTATMIYDTQPINDVFRKIDENTLLGVMDLKPIPTPYFFILTRDINPKLKWVK